MDKSTKYDIRLVREDLKRISRRSKDEYLKLRLLNIRARLGRLLLEEENNNG